MLLNAFSTAFTYSNFIVYRLFYFLEINNCEISKIVVNICDMNACMNGLYFQFEELWKIQYEKMGKS